MCQGATTNFGAFFVLRFLLGTVFIYAVSPLDVYSTDAPLGMCECCVAPILILIISMFYKKDEQVNSPSFKS